MGVLSFIAALVQALAWPIAIVTLAVVFRRQLRTLVAQFAGRMKDLKSLRAPGTEIHFADTLLAAQVEIAQLPEVITEHPPIDTAEHPRIVTTDKDSEEKETKDKESQQEPRLIPGPKERTVTADSEVGTDRPFTWPDSLAYDTRWRSAVQGRKYAIGYPETIVLGAWRYLDDTITKIARDMRIRIDKERGEWWPAWIVLRKLEQSGAISDANDVFSIVQKLRALKNSVLFETATVSQLEADEYSISARKVVKVIKNAYSAMQSQDRIRDESSLYGAYLAVWSDLRLYLWQFSVTCANVIQWRPNAPCAFRCPCRAGKHGRRDIPSRGRQYALACRLRLWPPRDVTSRDSPLVPDRPIGLGMPSVRLHRTWGVRVRVACHVCPHPASLANPGLARNRSSRCVSCRCL
jgi:hypothetical protein